MPAERLRREAHCLGVPAGGAHQRGTEAAEGLHHSTIERAVALAKLHRILLRIADIREVEGSVALSTGPAEGQRQLSERFGAGRKWPLERPAVAVVDRPATMPAAFGAGHAEDQILEADAGEDRQAGKRWKQGTLSLPVVWTYAGCTTKRTGTDVDVETALLIDLGAAVAEHIEHDGNLVPGFGRIVQRWRDDLATNDDGRPAAITAEDGADRAILLHRPEALGTAAVVHPRLGRSTQATCVQLGRDPVRIGRAKLELQAECPLLSLRPPPGPEIEDAPACVWNLFADRDRAVDEPPLDLPTIARQVHEPPAARWMMLAMIVRARRTARHASAQRR